MEAFVREINASYDIQQTSAMVSELWWVPLISVAIYLPLVALGKAWMKDKPPFSLRGPLFAWNVMLALYSYAGALVMAPPLWEAVMQRGFIHTVCYTTIHDAPMQSFFCLLFVISKIIEFGDTFFVIARKTPLNFLHWYHHATVCIFSWHSLAIKSAPAHWYCAMNYLVHSIMYTYYVVKSTGMRIPSKVARVITMMQLVQFMVGLIVTLIASYIYMVQANHCNITTENAVMGIVIYFSYLILFGNFFFRRYMTAPPKKVE